MIESLLQIGVVYLIVMLVVYILSDFLIFQPPAASYQDTSDIIKLKTKDGTNISALYLPNPEAKYTILYSHGNAEDIGAILPVLKDYQEKGFSIFAYDYHGYGTSEGSANEKNTYQDIEAAYEYLTTTLNIPAQNIILHGRSVGTGPSIELAIRKPIGGLILESGMTSTFRVVTIFPLFPVDKFSNLKKISKINAPILIVHGTKDRIIPFWHGKLLYQKANQSKSFYSVPDAGHNDIMIVGKETYWKTLYDWIHSIPKNNAKSPKL